MSVYKGACKTPEPAKEKIFLSYDPHYFTEYLRSNIETSNHLANNRKGTYILTSITKL
jgi:hypothetical protein